MLHCEHIPCADSFRAATFMLQTFQTTSKVPLGRGSILNDAVGVDGLTCSDPTLGGQVFMLKCHPWIGMLTHTVLENL